MMNLLKAFFCVIIFANFYAFAFHIDIKNRNELHLNGIKIDESNIYQHLEQHEKDLIFGHFDSKNGIKIVQVTRNNTQQRTKRSTEGQVSIKIQDSGNNVNLALRPVPKLIDDAFILIRRYENTSQFIEGSHKLAAKFERCFYRNGNAALDLCDDGAIRGIYRHNLKEYLIHPLPDRFGNNSHIIVAAGNSAYSSNTSQQNSIHFEPDEDDFNDKNVLSHRKMETINNYSTDNNSWKNRLRKYNQHRSHFHNIYKRRNFNQHRIKRRHITNNWKIPQVLHIETAIFVDRDLYQHMTKNFPKNTENHLIRFVLAMVNGVQLLYNHPSLGHQINFVLKRLEILHSDPVDLRRSQDIDTYLNNFCMWQKKLNPPADSDAVHYDHAVILTGLDLHVISKNGKFSSQVVGLAPVSGMCTSTSSCTINEGKHFESVFVVAHEIGHNLGMRHDTNENSCDPSLYIMSPTLGSGKITWSKCSRSYLNKFLDLSQAKCLFDRGQFGSNLDHSAEGMLPGERFDADQQCMLKYGTDSLRSRSQLISDICRDLHCVKDRFTWTSHPALEGTECGEMMWCRSGVCVMKAAFMESYSSPKQVNAGKQIEKVSFLENAKLSQLRQEHSFKSLTKIATWGEWGQPSACDSGCLYGPSGRLREGSTGLKVYTRSCLDFRRRCQGSDKIFESCIAKQCHSILKITVDEFASQVCERAMKFDTELTSKGTQIIGENVEDSCKVFCKTKTNGTKSRSWTFPDGTTCKSKIYNFDDTSYCISGRCERFACDNSSSNYFRTNPMYCSQNYDSDSISSNQKSTVKANNAYYYSGNNHYYTTNQENGRDYKSIKRGSGLPLRNKFENEINGRSFTSSNAIKRKIDSYQHHKSRNSNDVNSFESNEWIVKSGCHFRCMDKGKGIQIVFSKTNGSNNIQLCSPKIKPCDNLQTTKEYAHGVCTRYKLKVRGISGYGMQISPSALDPDRSCRVACQDEFLHHRYYIVNGNYGYFPLGTKCSPSHERYCVDGKCLEFDENSFPSTQSHISLALFRNKRDISNSIIPFTKKRTKRSFESFMPVNITETVTQEYLNSIISKINLESISIKNDTILNEHIEFMNPIHVSTDELINKDKY